ncbi:beta-lactamase/transpeptidase-like protein [Stipitochalara longipes BDJ]|nr:beta-lactamase/transpeptidase-like protein [Stipitochalara longipes BDJ]
MTKSSSSSQADIVATLQAILDSSIAAGVPGISASIRTSSQILWSSTAGFSDLSNQIPINDTHVFGIGSITKVFITIVILQLIEKDKLNLSDTISSLLAEEVFHGIGNAESATIGGLLRHSAGVESWEDDPKWIVEGRGKDLDPERVWGKQDTLEYIRHPSSLTPGGFSYANTNFSFLGLVIEKITGKSAESEIRRRILAPLGMKDTYLEGFEDGIGGEKVPRRYHFATKDFIKAAGICPRFPQMEWNGSNLIDATGSNTSVEWVAGGMLSSPPDLLKLAIAIRDGKLLSSSSMKTLQDWKLASKTAEIGHGLFRFKSPLGYGNWLGHNGSLLGFTGSLFWAEEGDCAVCVLANVGTMHAGDVPSSAAHVAINTEFLELAKKLTASVEGDKQSNT